MNLKTTHNTLIISKELFIAKRHGGININVLDLSTVKKTTLPSSSNNLLL